jgi:Purple acid Phosphatase, N-terminal domain
MASLHETGIKGSLSLDFVSHEATCDGFGAQIGTEVNNLTFVPSYACTDFTQYESTNTWLNRVLLEGLVSGQKYYYVVGSESSKAPWSQVYEFVYDQGSQRPGGPVFAMIADAGFYNFESLEKLQEEAYLGKFDALMHRYVFVTSQLCCHSFKFLYLNLCS